MEPKLLAQKINGVISIWAKDKPKLVVAIDGYTGIGKTTLLNNLAELNSNIIPVNRDDFLLSRKVIEEKLSKSNDRSKIFELEVCDDKKLENLVAAFRKKVDHLKIDTYDPILGEVSNPKDFDLSKNIMAVEGVFMFHPKSSLNKLWDKRIYLEGDTDKIDERRIRREKEKWGKDYFPETHPDSYFRQVIIGLKRYIELYKPEKIADFVLKV